MSHTNRSRWYVLVPLVLVSSVGLVAASRPAPLRPCEVVATWVAAHKANLPTTLAELATFSKAYQRSIYASMTPAVRVSIWREHLTPYLAPAAGLNEAQRALVRHVLDELEVLVTDPTGQLGRDQQKKEHLIATLQAEFSKAQITDIFTLNTIASLEQPSSAPPSPALAESAGVSASAAIEVCECSVESNGQWDCVASGCVDDGCAEVIACGFGWNEFCDGVCKPSGDR
jgi:hypothetical protein